MTLVKLNWNISNAFTHAVYKTSRNSVLPSLRCSTVWSESGTRLVWSGSVQSQLLMPEERNQPKIIQIIYLSLPDTMCQVPFPEHLMQPNTSTPPFLQNQPISYTIHSVHQSTEPDQVHDISVTNRLLGQLLRQRSAVRLSRLCVFLSLRRFFDPLDQRGMTVSVLLQGRAQSF